MPSVLAEASDAPVPPAASKPDMSVKQPTDQDRDTLLAIDADLDRMRNFIPSDPYVLTIPQDVEPRYHHSYMLHVHQWLDRTPFDRREHENSQYQTFHFHEPGKDMFVQHNSWHEDPTPSDVRDKSKPSAPGTGSNTPTNHVKKKITLSAYKKKQAGATPSQDPKSSTEDAPSKQPAVKGPTERIKETEDVLASLSEPEPQDNSREPKELKRKRNDDALPSSKDAPAQKKPRQLSPPRHIPKQKDPVAKVQSPRKPAEPASPRVDNTKLPPRLSPLQEDLELPTRLSPTLPAVYERALQAKDREAKELEAKAKQESTASAESSAPKEKLSSPKTNGVSQHKSSGSRNGLRADSISPGSRKRETVRAKSPNVDSSGGDEIPVKTRKTGEKKTLMIKLKYKRKNVPRVTRLLNMRPSPCPGLLHQSDPDEEVDKDEPSTKAAAPEPKKKDRGRELGEKGVAQKIGPSKVTDTKRGELSRLQNKRPRSLERPSTPADRIGPELVSPAMMSSAARGSQQATPGNKKEPRSAAMRREQSSDSHTLTPSAHATSTPSANGIGSSQQRAPSSQPIGSSKTPMQEGWEMEQKRLDKLGRELKHEASAHSEKADKSQGSAAENEKILAALKAIESFLSYNLAFTSGDEAAHHAEPRGGPVVKMWMSLPPYHGFVRKHCEVLPELTGIACQAGVVATARVFELSGSHSGEVSSSQKRDVVLAAWQKMSRDMAAMLPDETIKSIFPETWAGRSKTKDSREVRDPAFSKLQVPGKFDGEYEVSVGVHTTPLMVVRLCYRELLELAKKYPELGYTPRLKLR